MDHYLHGFNRFSRWIRCTVQFFKTRKTKRKDRDSLDEGKLYLQEDYIRQRVIDVDFDHMVSLPSGLDLQEWHASNTIKFFEHINQLYGAIAEYCTTSACSCMTAPNNVQYQWVEDRGKKVKCTAPQYIDLVMATTQKTICDETVFPTKYGNVFPACFDATIKRLFRLLFHVLAHIYHAHYKQVLHLNLQGHLNTVTLHFITFSKRFGLIDERESEVLDDLHKKLSTVERVRVIGKDDSRTSLSSNENTASGGDNNSTNNNSSKNCKPHSVINSTLVLKQEDFVDEENKENVISPPSDEELPLPPPPPLTSFHNHGDNNGSDSSKTGSNGSLPAPPSLHQQQVTYGHTRKTSST